MSQYIQINVTADQSSGNVVVQKFDGAAKTRTCLPDALAAANVAGLQCAQGMALPDGVDDEVARLVAVFADATDLRARTGV